MCLAVPMVVTEVIDGDTATVTLDGVSTQVSIALTPDVQPGDFVIVHVGFALEVLDADAARQTLELMARSDTP